MAARKARGRRGWAGGRARGRHDDVARLPKPAGCTAPRRGPHGDRGLQVTPTRRGGGGVLPLLRAGLSADSEPALNTGFEKESLQPKTERLNTAAVGATTGLRRDI